MASQAISSLKKYLTAQAEAPLWRHTPIMEKKQPHLFAKTVRTLPRRELQSKMTVYAQVTDFPENSDLQWKCGHLTQVLFL